MNVIKVKKCPKCGEDKNFFIYKNQNGFHCNKCNFTVKMEKPEAFALLTKKWSKNENGVSNTNGDKK